jgi:lipoprotein-anchoring transpeptidase ErfK/SrfK
MNTIFKSAAAAIAAVTLVTTLSTSVLANPANQTNQASNSLYGGGLYGGTAGIVITPAAVSASTDVDATDTFPNVKRGQIVAFATQMKRGDIFVDSTSNRLYFVLGYGKAVMYRVATARTGFEWSGSHAVSGKTEWPDWRPSADMRAREPKLPELVKGGPKNPLGARAIYLGSSLYRIHGTNAPKSIGTAASHGCIRMLNDDVTELYQLVKIGAEVTVK